METVVLIDTYPIREPLDEVLGYMSRHDDLSLALDVVLEAAFMPDPMEYTASALCDDLDAGGPVNRLAEIAAEIAPIIPTLLRYNNNTHSIYVTDWCPSSHSMYITLIEHHK